MSISSLEESGSKKSLYRRVTGEILRDIWTGNLPLGSKLPSQAELIDKYKVSITTIRQSLASLERRGIVRKEHGRGTFVSLQSGRRGRSSELTRVGLIFERADRPEDQPAETEIVAAFVKTCRKHRIRFSVFDIDSNAHVGGMELIQSFDGMPLDGVCVFLHSGGEAQERLALFAREFAAPVVFFPSFEEHVIPIDCVHIEVRTGLRHMMKYLLSMGHRRIGFICSHIQECLAGDPKRITGGRWEAYAQELKSAGIEVDPSLLVEIPYGKDPDAQIGGKIVELVRRKDPVTAIYAGNDWMARHAMEWLWRNGIHVPDDVSVVGLDDVSFARQLIPPLTTVACPYVRAAETIIDLMKQRLAKPGQPLQKVMIPSELVVRDSVRVLSSR